MRLSTNEVEILKKSLLNISNDAKLYLFGSRTDDSKKGGDIDILILSDKLTKRDIRKIRIDFFENFGEQKLDIVLDKTNAQKTFTKHILKQAIEL